MIHTRRGFTLLEILIALAVVTALAWISFGALSAFNKGSQLDTAAGITIAILDEARTLTLASRGDSVHGVHIEDDAVTLFKGTSYDAIDPENERTALPSAVTITDISVVGGGADIIFDRLTGVTSQEGVVTLSLASDTTRIRVLRIDSTGLIELE